MPTDTFTIAGGEYDAFEIDDDTGFDGTGADVIVRGNSAQGTRRNGGFIFTLTGVNQGATFSSATLQPVLSNSTFVSIQATILGEDVDATATYVADADVTTRKDTNPTTATVAWSNASLGVAGDRVTSPDIASILNEIVGRAGWSNDGDVNIILAGTTAGGQARFAADEHGTHAPADLVATWTNPSSGTANPLRISAINLLQGKL